MDKWAAFKAWRDKLISKYRAQEEIGKTTPIGRGGMMMINAVKEYMDELERLERASWGEEARSKSNAQDIP